MQQVSSPLTQEVRQLFFAYDKGLPLEPVEKPLPAPEGHVRTHFEIQTTHDQRVPGILHTPTGSGPFPLLVMQHGAGSEKEAEYITKPAEYWAEREGWAVLAIDAPHHGERTTVPFDRQALFQYPYRWRDHAVQAVQDLMRALDYAETRPELDNERVGYIGFSMGTILGVAFVALDQRIKAAVFAIGGSVTLTRLQQFSGQVGEEVELIAELVDSATYAPQIAPRPVLMINGRSDEVVSPETGQRLFDALQEPKRIEWFDGGHYDMRGKEFKLIRDFFTEHL
jgi:dienelactone hydrolase